jgi:site-specific recombinase XerD
VRVQRVVMPWDAVSWTVLEDNGDPVGVVDRFLGFLSSSEKSPNTVRSYAHDLKDWFCYLSGRDLAWDEVTLEASSRSSRGCGCRRRAGTGRSPCWASRLITAARRR